VTEGRIVIFSDFSVFLVALSASAGMVQAKITPYLPSPLDLAQVQAFLDHASFSVTAVCRPCDHSLLEDFSPLSKANFRNTTPSLMNQYFEGFDLLLCLILITPYYAIFDHRKLVTMLEPIDATTKVQKLFDLHIRRRKIQKDSLDGALDKAPVTFICLPDQLDRVSRFGAMTSRSSTFRARRTMPSGIRSRVT
jgi:hypothetical protein